MSEDHTPGPWIAVEVGFDSYQGDAGRWQVEECGREQFVLAVTIGDAPRLRETEEANARLIAAAPELLEAVKALRELALHAAELDHPIIQQADSAIAKATRS